MAVGNTTSTVLADSIDTIVASARSTEEYAAVVPQLVDKATLVSGTDTWKEVLFAQLSAMAITEQTENENPQLFSDSAITITPQGVQILTFITDKVRRNLNRKSLSQMGKLEGEAMRRKEDEDGLTAMDGSTTQLGTANTPLVTGDIAAARYRITSNATEPGPMPISFVGHGFCIKDFYDELVAGIGTYPVPAGSTAQVFRSGFTLPVANVTVHEDGNIAIDSADDAKNFVFSKSAWVLVRDLNIKTEIERKPGRGGGGDNVYMTAFYAYGERSPGNWSYELIGDASNPT